MKSKYSLILILSAAVFAAGCKPADPPRPDESIAGQSEQVKKEMKGAAQAAQDYTYSRKDEFVEKMKTDLAEMRLELDRLGEKIEASTASSKDEAKAKLQTLRDKTVELEGNLDGVGAATESTWENVKNGFKIGFDEVKSSFNDAKLWISDKLTP